MQLSVKELKSKIEALVESQHVMSQEELNWIFLDTESFKEYSDVVIACQLLRTENKINLVETKTSFYIKKTNLVKQ